MFPFASQVLKSLLSMSLLAFIGCASTSTKMPGETQMDPTYYPAIVRAIGAHEAGAPGGRSKPEVVDTKILGGDGKSRSEIWTVLRRDEKIHYEVTVSPSAEAGQQVVVRRIRARRHDGN